MKVNKQITMEFAILSLYLIILAKCFPDYQGWFLFFKIKKKMYIKSFLPCNLKY